MSKDVIQMPEVAIAREHQSSPRKHYADVALEQAAEEIASGKYVPPEREGELNIALRAGIGEATFDPSTTTAQHFEETAFSLDLAYHPRVAEALDRMAREVETKRDSGQEYIEQAMMLHELNENAQQKNRWPGQERWMDAEAEEKRMGKVMGPADFFRRLCEVIGSERVYINRFAVLPHPEAKSGRVALLIRDAARYNEKKYGIAKLDPHSMRLTVQLRQMEKDFTRVADEAKKKAMHAQINAIGVQLDEAEKRRTADEFRDFLMVGTLQWPMMTEWMMMNFDEFGVPTTAKFIGWRTALLSMIRAGAITEKEAHKAFPVRGGHGAADWYLEQLWEWRNGNRPRQSGGMMVQ